MKRLLIVLLVFVFPFYTNATTDTTRVLFIGNSLTYTYDIPGLVKALENTAGLPFTFTMHAPAGITVGDVYQDTNAHAYNPEVFDLIRQGNWNYVVIQDNQGRFIYGKGRFPSPTDSKVVEGHLKILDSVRYYNKCAHVLLYCGFAFKNGYAPYGNTGIELINNINEDYNYLNTKMKEIISPIGAAWVRAIPAVPSRDLWGPDETHQSYAGSYLTAAVIFTSIFHINTELIRFNGDIDTASAQTYRRIAYQTVMDSLKSTGLANFIPALSYDNSKLMATTGYSNYEWLKNGVSISSGSANTLAMPGASDCFQVIGTDAGRCKQASAVQCYYPLSINNVQNDELVIYPNPATDALTITAGHAGISKHCIIRDIAGHKIHDSYFNSISTSIVTADINPGIYFCTLIYGNVTTRTKFVKAGK